MICYFFYQIVLVQSKSYTIDETSAERLFGGGRTYLPLVTKGPVIGLEFAGKNCVSICREALSQLISTKYQNLPRKHWKISFSNLNPISFYRFY